MNGPTAKLVPGVMVSRGTLIFARRSFGRQRDGETWPEDGDRHLLEQPRQRADVILVSVRQDDAAQQPGTLRR